MNRRIYALLILIVVSSQVFAQTEKEAYTITVSQENLKGDEITTALNFLDLSFKKFVYEIPHTHKIEFTSECFESGRDLGVWGKSLMTRAEGKHTLLVFLHREKRSLKIGIFEGLGGGSFSSPLDKKYKATSCAALSGKKLVPDEKIPIFAFAANQKSIKGIREEQTVDDIKSEYEFVIILFANLMLSE
ncbi:hypothetical protein KAW48_10160 [candidate division WOR-3 bacterium]|nr:hypothetical protein [candidate division WOR-3 bacterium]